jgi:hypothetical protein
LADLQNFHDVVFAVMKMPHVQREHAGPVSDGGCTIYLDDDGVPVERYRACHGATEEWARWTLKKCLTTLYKKLEYEMLQKKHFTPQQRANWLAAEWISRRDDATRHAFGDHILCDPDACPWAEGSTKVLKYVDIAVTCKAVQKEISNQLDVYFAPCYLWQLCGGGYGNFSTQKNECTNGELVKFAQKGVFTPANGFVLKTGMAMCKVNELAIARNTNNSDGVCSTPVISRMNIAMESVGRLPKGCLETPPRVVVQAHRRLRNKVSASERAADPLVQQKRAPVRENKKRSQKSSTDPSACVRDDISGKLFSSASPYVHFNLFVELIDTLNNKINFATACCCGSSRYGAGKREQARQKRLATYKTSVGGAGSRKATRSVSQYKMDILAMLKEMTRDFGAAEPDFIHTSKIQNKTPLSSEVSEELFRSVQKWYQETRGGANSSPGNCVAQENGAAAGATKQGGTESASKKARMESQPQTTTTTTTTSTNGALAGSTKKRKKTPHPYPKGTRVECKYNIGLSGGPDIIKWYSGSVSSATAKKIVVQYDDGDSLPIKVAE